MNQDKAYEFYQECLKMDLSTMMELILNTKSEDEKSFYTDLYNFVLRIRQKECIANGVF